MNPNGDYDFILNPEKPKKQPVDLMKNPKMLFAFVGFSLVLIVVLFVILSAVLSSGNKSQKNNFTEIAKTQTEIIRIADLVEKNKSATDTTQYRALNIKLTTLGAQNYVTTMIKKRGVKKLNSKIIASGKDTSVDDALEKASNNNKFNETFNKTMDDKLDIYAQQVQTAYDAGNKSEKAQLKSIYTNISKLQSKPTNP